MNHDAIINLQAALSFAPEKVGLRLVLAHNLAADGRLSEAEREYREILSNSPGSIEAKGGLAKLCLAQGRHSMAFVILEEICGYEETAGDYHVLYARELLKENQKARAKDEYRTAVRKGHTLKFGEVEYLFG